MFYRPQDGHGLPHSPFNAIVAPRPIGWISTRGPLGDNLAPYSFFNAVAYTPPQVIFAGTLKDSVRNAQESGVFAVNVVSQALWAQMNATSAHLPRGSDEFAHAGVEKAECQTIDCPRAQASPATLECRVQQVITLQGGEDYLVIGTVTGVHIRDEFLSEGRLDLTLYKPMARAGYKDYAVIERLISLERPE
jgi:flavin reductase (DIM6/NTAB) family NADH-FMN oxidoreductase RutF